MERLNLPERNSPSLVNNRLRKSDVHGKLRIRAFANCINCVNYKYDSLYFLLRSIKS